MVKIEHITKRVYTMTDDAYTEFCKALNSTWEDFEPYTESKEDLEVICEEDYLSDFAWAHPSKVEVEENAEYNLYKGKEV